MSYEDFRDAKERIREAVDIVDVIGGYHPLRRQGRVFVTLCPWHSDSRPSLQINPDRQTWKCWVCDIGGDVFSFVMKQENLDFREALQLLAEKAGIPLPTQRSQSSVVEGSPNDKKTLLKAADWVASQFHDCLLKSPQAEAARSYLEERGINGESVERFRIGLCPESWTWILDRARGTPYSPAILDAIGLLGKSEKTGQYYERFRGRVMFPICDVMGRTVGFGGRILPQLATETTSKYINGNETRLYSKSDNLYGLHIARQHVGTGANVKRNLVVVEGYTDVVMCHQFGLQHVVAVLGTALNERHIRLLRRFADQVVLVLDGDEAGQRRTNQVLDLFVAEQVDLRVLTLPEEFDPCEFLLERGGEPFQTMLDQAIDALEHKLRAVTQGIDLLNDTHAANQALEKMLATMAKVTYDTTDAAARLRGHQMLMRLARTFMVPESEIRSRLDGLRRAQAKASGQFPQPVESPASKQNLHSNQRQPPRQKLSAFPPCELELLEILTQHGEFMSEITDQVASSQLVHEAARAIFETFDRVFAEGEPPQFGRVLSYLEDPELQNLLIQIEEQASAKETYTSEPARTRLARLLETFRSGQTEREIRSKQAALANKKFDHKEEQEVFMQLLAQARAKHGLVTPTDG